VRVFGWPENLVPTSKQRMHEFFGLKVKRNNGLSSP